MKLLTIRHGEYIDQYDAKGRKLIHFPNSPLSQLGKLQIQELGKELRSQQIIIDALYTSPYLRAKQTAETLANELNIPYIFEVEGLIDVFPNSAEGKPYEAVEVIGGDIYSHPLDNDPQESLEHLINRVRSALDSILLEARRNKFTTIGLCSHGDTLSALDWALKYDLNTLLYSEMRDSFYLQKAEACDYILNESGRLEGKGKIITTSAVNLSIEGFRNLRGERD